MIQTLKTTSLANSPINIECVKSQPFDTQRTPFQFVEEDISTGVQTPYDITSLDFEIIIYQNYSNIELTSTNLVKADTNKLYLDLTAQELSFDTGVYDYEIRVVGGISMIKGKFKLVKNGK